MSIFHLKEQERCNLTLRLPRKKRLLQSKLALALPVTFLILFVTSLGIVSITYYISVQKISTQNQMIKIETAKQNFIELNEKVLATIWQPGSSATLELKDAGGTTKIQPTAASLTIEISDANTIEQTIYNGTVGKLIYELPYAQASQAGTYLYGDSRTIVNQTGSTQTQLSIVRGLQHPEIQLSYRPLISHNIEGPENGKMINTIRIYTINLNSSNNLDIRGELPLKITCLNAEQVDKNFEVNYQLQEISITSTKDDNTGTAVVPISSLPQGAIIKVEIVIINVAIERWLK
jgi:hypothetical protein